MSRTIVTARKVLDSGGAFAELRVGKVRLLLTSREAALVTNELAKLPDVTLAFLEIAVEKSGAQTTEAGDLISDVRAKLKRETFELMTEEPE